MEKCVLRLLGKIICDNQASSTRVDLTLIHFNRTNFGAKPQSQNPVVEILK